MGSSAEYRSRFIAGFTGMKDSSIFICTVFKIFNVRYKQVKNRSGTTIGARKSPGIKAELTFVTGDGDQ